MDTPIAGLPDRYDVQRQIGAGGMATVYLARDVKHNRDVALKVLHTELSSSVGAERFAQEIQTAARLQHPHILAVFDSGESAGRLWFTMPYVQGESLRDRLKRESQLPVEEAVRIATETARALAYAHAEGVVHRDIKPENLLLTRDGSVLVADFGIARVVDAMHGGLTSTGMTLGTPAYMSPEQASGERQIDARSDVYALGAVLYEMLAGEPAFSGPNAQAVLARVLTQTPRPIGPIRAAMPRAIDAVIAKAMAHTPADRYATMDAFAAALGSAASGTGGGPERLPRRRLIVAGVIAAAVGVTAAAVLVAKGDRLFSHTSHAIYGSAPTLASVAVLPFENRGSAEDAHIADGIADEIRGKLAGIPGLTVIARASSNEYRGSTKHQEQIASELGVNYLLSGTVQFERVSSGRPTRLRVSPELVQIVKGAAPATRWQQPFDADLADVFAVQSDIAGRVASALDVALSVTDKGRLANRPTENMEAYDAYLKGEEISGALTDAPTLDRALVEYHRAVTLDPHFAAAWARISRAHELIFYWTRETVAEDSLSREAAKRAVSLAPDRWEGHWALGLYLAAVAHTPVPAMAEDRIALRLAPSNAEVLSALSIAQLFAGQWEASARSAGQATVLDPRSVEAYRNEGLALMDDRRYAAGVVALEKALAIDPNDPSTHFRLFLVRLAQGDSAAAFAALAIPQDAAAQAQAIRLAGQSFIPVIHESLIDAFSRLDARSFPDGRVGLASARAHAYEFHGDEANARAFADTVLAAVRDTPNASPHAQLTNRARLWALTKLGRRAEAFAVAGGLLRSLPVERDGIDGAINAYAAAQCYATLGEHKRAIDVLASLLDRKTWVQPGWVRFDPTFNVLRGDPSFDRLLGPP